VANSVGAVVVVAGCGCVVEDSGRGAVEGDAAVGPLAAAELSGAGASINELPDEPPPHAAKTRQSAANPATGSFDASVVT